MAGLIIPDFSFLSRGFFPIRLAMLAQGRQEVFIDKNTDISSLTESIYGL